MKNTALSLLTLIGVVDALRATQVRRWRSLRILAGGKFVWPLRRDRHTEGAWLELVTFTARMSDF